jgi:hypothetical protein
MSFKIHPARIQPGRRKRNNTKGLELAPKTPLDMGSLFGPFWYFLIKFVTNKICG